MKKSILLFSIIAAAFIAVPTITRAQDNGKKPESAESSKPAKKHGLSIHGKVAAVDTTAMTVTVGKSTANVTSETKILKDGKPATLADVTVGEMISIVYKKNDSGKMDATTIYIGGKAKGESKKKKPENE